MRARPLAARVARIQPTTIWIRRCRQAIALAVPCAHARLRLVRVGYTQAMLSALQPELPGVVARLGLYEQPADVGAARSMRPQCET